MAKKPTKSYSSLNVYDSILGDISRVIDAARRSAARSINCVMTSAYWLIGRRIVEFEQKGEKRAGYGEELLQRLSSDLGKRFGRGFSRQNLQQMRQFYLFYPPEQICQTSSGILPTPPAESSLAETAHRFPLPWSAYVRLLSVRNENARRFYETEALRGGWSVRQMDRQINSRFYERTALSKNKAAMLTSGQKALPEDLIFPEEELKDPYVLEFLGLKDEYSETDMEEALIRHLETFLLELGDDFCFEARQKRILIGDTNFFVDLVFYHQILKCHVLIELKVDEFTHEHLGQLNSRSGFERTRFFNGRGI